MCKDKVKEERQKKIQMIKGLNNQNEVWKYLNGARKRKEKIENDIRKEEGKGYFKELLGGSDEGKLGQSKKQEPDENEKERMEKSYQERKLVLRGKI